MATIAEVLRPYFLSRLLMKQDFPELSFRGWVARKSYRITEPISNKYFLLDVYSEDEIINPFAYDINRMAASSFESIDGINPHPKLPKSTGWLIVRLYYSAYFAMHAILRFFGISCTQFDSCEVRSIDAVSKINGNNNGVSVSSGYFKCEYNQYNENISCQQLSNTHQDVWRTFFELLGTIAGKVAASDFRKADKDEVIDFLYSLRTGLSCNNTVGNGAWLSRVRNEVNYTHSMGAWYPYSGASNKHQELFRMVSRWRESPSDKFIKSHEDSCGDLLFSATCVSIVSLCHALVLDVGKINNGTFLKYSAIRLVNQLNI